MNEMIETSAAIAALGLLFLLVFAGLGIDIKSNGPTEEPPDTQEMHDLVG
jgi:hypothetical protein